MESVVYLADICSSWDLSASIQSSTMKQTPIIGSSHRGPASVASWNPLTKLLSYSRRGSEPCNVCHSEGQSYAGTLFSKILGPHRLGPTLQIWFSAPSHSLPAAANASFSFSFNVWIALSVLSVSTVWFPFMMSDGKSSVLLLICSSFCWPALEWRCLSSAFRSSVWDSRRCVTSAGRGTARTFTVDCLLGVRIIITSSAFSLSPSCNKQRTVLSSTNKPWF